MISRALVIIFILLPTPALAGEIIGQVYHVIDGDTFKYKNKIGNRDQCRMLGYNAPKMDEAVPEGVPDGDRARERLARLIDEKKIKIKADKRGNRLCRVWLRNGKHVNHLMRLWLEAQGYKDVEKYEWVEER